MSSPIPRLSCSAHFLSWLAHEGISLAATTYQTNRLLLFGRREDGTLSGFERLLDRPMGLHATPDRLTLSTRYQLWEFDHALPPGQTHDGYDRLYVPRRAHVTGELDIHDVWVDGGEEAIFVNTLYSCLASPAAGHSFRPRWTPPWISALVPEERCHLNGLALRDGVPAFVTSVSRSDVAQGWRERRADGGVVADVATGEVVCSGLSMPHSPRWHRGRLWVLNSGTGELGTVDLGSGRFEPVVFLPGFGRGLAFHGRYAIAGLSKPRQTHQNRLFHGLPLGDRLRAKDAVPQCGLYVVDLDAGYVAHWLHFEATVEELYDVQVIPGVRQPMALGFRSDEIRRHISIATDEGVVVHTLAALSDAPAPDAPAPDAPTGTPLPAATPPPRAQGAAPPASPADRGLAVVVGEGTMAELRSRYAALLFDPALRDNPSAAGAVLGAVARQGVAPVGLAVATVRAGVGRLCSLRVEQGHRNFGIATALVERLEGELVQRGCRAVEAAYRTSWAQAGAFERVLRKRGWAPPRTQQYLFRLGSSLCEAPWLALADRPLPPTYEVFAWSALTADERRAIEARQGTAPWFPPALTPFQREDRREPLNSLGVRRDGEVVGWMVTHRLKPDLVQYTSLCARPEVPRAVLLGLLARAVRRQCAAGLPGFAAIIDVEHREMLRLAERRLAPYEDSRAEVRVVGKVLA